MALWSLLLAEITWEREGERALAPSEDCCCDFNLKKKKKSRSGVELSLIFASLCGIWICFSASDRPAVLSSSYFCFGALSLLHVQWQQRENVVPRRCPRRCVSLSCNASAILNNFSTHLSGAPFAKKLWGVGGAQMQMSNLLRWHKVSEGDKCHTEIKWFLEKTAKSYPTSSL